MINQIILISLTITSIILMITIMSLLMSIKKKLKQEVLKLPQSTSLEEVNSLIDSFIANEFENYRLMYLQHTKDYINRESEKKIMKEMIDRISSRISLSIMNSVALYYNEKSISDMIVEKVYLIVSLYVAENNRIRDDSNTILKNKAVR